MGGVSGGGIDRQLYFSLQFHQPSQNVIQQHSYSPLQISCMERDRKIKYNNKLVFGKTLSTLQSTTLIWAETVNYHNQPWRFPVVHLVHSGSPLLGLWHIVDSVLVSAHVTQRCSDGEAGAQCSGATWDPMPGQKLAAVHSTSGTCFSAGAHPAWYWEWGEGKSREAWSESLVLGDEIPIM